MTVANKASIAPKPSAVARNGAEALLQLFVAQGVDYLFFNPGTDTAPIIEALVALARDGRPVPKLVQCLYENVALAAAHAYFLLTRRPQVVLVHVDVGTQNLGGMLHNAQRGHAGVVIVAGRAPYTVADEGSAPGGRDRSIQWQQDEPDQIGIVRNYVKWSHELGRVDTLQYLVPRAFQIAAAEPSGPVYMTVAREVLMEPIHAELALQAFTPLPCTPAADPGGIETLARWLAEAQHPLIVVGELGRHPASVAELVRLAELVGCPVASVRGPLSFPFDHALSIAEPGQYLREADLVLLLDVDVPWVPAVAKPTASARIAQIDLDPVHQTIPYWGFPVHLSLQADTSLAVPQLVAAVQGLATPEQRANWAGRMAHLGAADAQRQEHRRTRLAAARGERPLSADWVVAALAQVLPEDAVIVEEVTTSGAAVRRNLVHVQAGALLTSGGPGLGFVPGGGLGAKLAAPDRTVVVLSGDGSFVFGSPIAALCAAHDASAPFLTVIFNNGGYNASKMPVIDLFPTGAAVEADDFPATRFQAPPDYSMIARACHAYGERVTDPDEVVPALERALSVVRSGQAAVLDMVLKMI